LVHTLNLPPGVSTGIRPRPAAQPVSAPRVIQIATAHCPSLQILNRIRRTMTGES
jgi:hypothetical protein